MLIHTSRLILRPWVEGDAEVLYRLASDPVVGPRAGWPVHESVDESRQVIRQYFVNDCTWAVTLKATGQLLGCIGFYTYGQSNIDIGENDAEVGYWIGRQYWGCGYCTEALTAIVDHCFDTRHFDTLWADHFVDNLASRRVMTKCGFADTGIKNYSSRLAHPADAPICVMKLTKEGRQLMVDKNQ